MMALFVEVDSIEKQCKVIVNLDSVIEIAPLASGGCVLFFADSTSTGGKIPYKVTNNYDQFVQFAMQTVSSEDIAKRFPTKKSKDSPIEIPKL